MIIKSNRRQFLQGAGGFTLSLPLLVSLLPKKLWAQGVKPPPRFVCVGGLYGGMDNRLWIPQNIAELETGTDLYPGMTNPYVAGRDAPPHRIHSAHLSSIIQKNGQVSQTFDSKFNPYAGKMLLLNGLDGREMTDGPIVHNQRACLGYYYEPFKDPLAHFKTPTIDQIMAYSNGFYAASNTVKSLQFMSHSINAGDNPVLSYRFQNRFQNSGNIVPTPYNRDPRETFAMLFQTNNVPPPQQNSTTPVVDAVMEDFRRVRDGRMISAHDRNLLEATIQELAEIERRLGAMGSTGTCSEPSVTNSLNTILSPRRLLSASEFKQLHEAYNDVIVAAFRCNATRIATINLNETPVTTSDDLWHHWTHNGPSGVNITEAERNQNLLSVYKGWADDVVLDLVSKLDGVADVDGNTLLDNSLVQYSLTSSGEGHNPTSIPHVLFGSAGGYFQTGQFIDYSNRSISVTDSENAAPGLLHNRYLVDAMRSMGLRATDWDMTTLFGQVVDGDNTTPSSYEMPANVKGYGVHWYQTGKQQTYAYYYHGDNDIDKPLPLATTQT